MGVTIGLVIVVAAVVVGAFYFWNTRMHEQALQEKELRDLAAQSASTEKEAIEADLVAESPDTFDAELDAAMSDLDAAFTAE